ncbi:FAD-dependent oxidoreductase [Chloroflexota bacterium]
MPKVPKLADPIMIGGLELKNRVVMAPMKDRLATDEGFVTPRLIDYYVERAKGEVALLITGITHVHPSAKQFSDLAIYDDKFIPGLRELVTAVHQNGAKIAPQLYHPGRRTRPLASDGPILAPSAIPESPVWETPREITKEEIKEVITSFAEATARAAEAGFDAIELHGAHHYLLLQFFSPLANQRQDEYGGSLENRMRFGLELVAAVRAKVGPSFPMLYRLGAWEEKEGGVTIDQAKVFAQRLEAAGINCLNISVGSIGIIPVPPMSMPRGTFVPLAHEIKKVVKVPVIGVGRINNPFLAESIIREGKADLVCLGRPLLSDPHFMRKYLDGHPEDIRTCLACGTCTGLRLRLETPTYRFPLKCIYNPELCNERALAVSLAPVRKKVLVVGGGPAGMEAARVAALRGHQVILCEKGEKLGGQIRLAAVPPYRNELAEMITFYSTQLTKLRVEVRLSTEVTSELAKDINPEVIIVANGSHFIVPRVKGIEGDIVRTAADILSERLRPKGKVVVIGSGQYALETAEYLAWHNCQVNVMAGSSEASIATDLSIYTRRLLLERLATDYDGLNIIYDAKLKEIAGHEVIYSQGGREAHLKGLDMVVLGITLIADKELYSRLKPVAAELGAEIHAVGDCQKPQRTVQAVENAFLLARQL